MNLRPACRHRLIMLTAVAFSWLVLSQANAQSAKTGGARSKSSVAINTAEPTAAQLKAMVEQTLKKNPYYSPGFLISRRDVESLFAQLLADGVTSTEDQEDLSECVLSDSSFLVGRLKTPAGRVFMKKIASDPTVYDRLERLSWTPDGRQLIDSFVKAKDGAAQLQQLKTSAQLAKLSKRLAADASTPDFALQTSRCHTAEELVTKLTEVIAAKNSAETSAE
jgi:hypothetical protein